MSVTTLYERMGTLTYSSIFNIPHYSTHCLTNTFNTKVSRIRGDALTRPTLTATGVGMRVRPMPELESDPSPPDVRCVCYDVTGIRYGEIAHEFEVRILGV